VSTEVIESAEPRGRADRVHRRIADACRRVGRDPEEVRLIAVTKDVTPDAVRRAWDQGLREFGENYVNGLTEKRRAAPEARWHFIGRLQRNKVRRVLDMADVVQTLEPGKAADRLAELAAGSGPPCLVEVDFTGRRVGVLPEEADVFVDRMVSRGVRVTGLMTIPPIDEPPRPYFARLRELRDRLNERFDQVMELSMGMSADYEEAVEEGATMVRVGTAIFGPRP
jgi:pyridoxal phosphate enzyme (YggS family)